MSGTDHGSRPIGKNIGHTKPREAGPRVAPGVPARERGGTDVEPSPTHDHWFGALKVLLEEIPKDFPALDNKVKVLLLHIESLDTLFATAPRDDVWEENWDQVQEQSRRKRLIQDIERRLKSSPEKQGLQLLVDHSQDMLVHLEDIQEAIFQYQRGRQMSIDSQGSIQMDKEDANVLNKIRCAERAEYRHSDREGCLRGTRGAILDEIELWASDSSSPSVYWLNGLVGTGKTTIAQTVAENISKLSHSFA